MASTRLAAHQPDYLPWPGYFYKILAADVFVILDDVQFERGRSYQSRTQIKTPNGPLWLSQPVARKGKGLQRIDEVELVPGEDWRGKHLKTLRSSYARATQFAPGFAALEAALGEARGSLGRVNEEIIRALLAHLGIERRILRSSELGINSCGAERLLDICTALGASAYVSGRGAMAYQDPARFAARGVTLLYSNYAPTPYPQLWGEFVPGLSVADALLNLGADGLRAGLEATAPPTPAR